jgi:hypothetical protein
VDKLISFVIGNFPVVVVVISVIYMLFFRKSPLEKPPNRMPDFGGDGQRRPRPPMGGMPPLTPTTRPQPPAGPYPAPQRQQPPAMPSGAPLSREPRQLETRQPQPKPSVQRPIQAARPAPDIVLAAPDRATRLGMETKMAPIDTDARPHSVTVASPTTTGLTKNDLSKAVLWAEILGPPRARRPYRR